MRLNWEDQGSGSYYARDEVTGLSAQVEKSGVDPARPFVWFIADLPTFPDGFDDSDFHGRAATSQEAKTEAEYAMPDATELACLREEAEIAWRMRDKARRDAAPNN